MSYMCLKIAVTSTLGSGQSIPYPGGSQIQMSDLVASQIGGGQNQCYCYRSKGVGNSGPHHISIFLKKTCDILINPTRL